MIATGVVMDAGMVYADARASHHYPTLEIRAADVCLDVRDTVLLAAICRGLVDTAVQQWTAGVPPVATPTTLLRLATWQAARDGVAGVLLDPFTTRPKPAREVVTQLLGHIAPALRSLATTTWSATARRPCWPAVMAPSRNGRSSSGPGA